jgi:hypothetical protein
VHPVVGGVFDCDLVVGMKAQIPLENPVAASRTAVFLSMKIAPRSNRM